MIRVVDQPFLKNDAYTRIGYKSYDNNALVYRWSDAPLIIGKYCSISYNVRFIMDDGGIRLKQYHLTLSKQTNAIWNVLVLWLVMMYGLV